MSLRDLTRFRLRRRGGAVRVEKNLVYRAGSKNPKHRLDVYLPEDERGAPTVHFLHGGYWIGGDRNYRNAITGLYGSVGETLAGQGITTVIQSYRLGAIETILVDVRAALAWTKSRYPGDLFLMGHSAGGHLAALLADEARGAIVLSGIWDIEDMARSQDGRFQERVTYPVFGRDPSKRAAYNPAPTVPTLIMVGDRDYPYLIPQAERARDRIPNAEYHLATGNDHDAMVLRIGAYNDNLTEVIASFVRRSRST